MSKQDFNEYDNQGKKGMSGIAKIISIIIVLLLLGGLTFAIFSFVDFHVTTLFASLGVTVALNVNVSSLSAS